MLYTLKAPFIGRLYIGHDSIGHMKAQRDDLEVELLTSRPSQPGLAVLVDEIAMTTRVPSNKLDEFISQVGQEPMSGGVLTELRQRLTHELQTFESGFSFAYSDEFPIERIASERWIEIFTPEGQFERDKLRINRVGAIRPAAEMGAVVEWRHLQYYFDRSDRYTELRIPLAFFREGMNAYLEERFVTAFHNFYFIVEDWYAGGKFREREVLQAFNNSDELKQILEEVITQITGDPAHSPAFVRMFADEGLNLAIDGFIELLPALRGHLHHYTSKGPKPRGTPFNAANFRTAAHALRLIAGLTVRFRMMEIDKELDPNSLPGINWGRLLS